MVYAKFAPHIWLPAKIIESYQGGNQQMGGRYYSAGWKVKFDNGDVREIGQNELMDDPRRGVGGRVTRMIKSTHEFGVYQEVAYPDPTRVDGLVQYISFNDDDYDHSFPQYKVNWNPWNVDPSLNYSAEWWAENELRRTEIDTPRFLVGQNIDCQSRSVISRNPTINLIESCQVSDFTRT